MKMYTKTCMDAGGLHQDAQETIFIDTLTSEGGATLLRSRYCTPFLSHLTALQRKRCLQKSSTNTP